MIGAVIRMIDHRRQEEAEDHDHQQSMPRRPRIGVSMRAHDR